MSVAAEAIAIVNAALSRTGNDLITGSDFGTGVSTDGIFKQIAYLNYEQIVKTALLSRGWRFARKTDDCTLVGASPDDLYWKFQWTLPDDLLLLRTLIRAASVGTSSIIIRYEIDAAGDVLTNYDDGVKAIYTYRAAESLWPADFSEAITLRMQALYKRADDQAQEADLLDEAAMGLINAAAIVHAQEEMATDRRVFPLVRVRRTGYGSCPR